MGFFDNLSQFCDRVKNNAEIREARAKGINEAESYRRSDLMEAELEYRIKTVIRKLEDMNGNRDLIERLQIRVENKVYDYQDLLKLYGYDEEIFDLKKISSEDIWDPARYVIARVNK